jgi:hypothetical protein
MNTKLVFESVGYAASAVEDGVEATLRLVLAPELAGVTGRYFERFRGERAAAQAYDRDARRRLWRLSEHLVGIERPPLRRRDPVTVGAGRVRRHIAVTRSTRSPPTITAALRSG